VQHKMMQKNIEMSWLSVGLSQNRQGWNFLPRCVCTMLSSFLQVWTYICTYMVYMKFSTQVQTLWALYKVCAWVRN
jgi:hypothetical protein